MFFSFFRKKSKKSQKSQKTKFTIKDLPKGYSIEQNGLGQYRWKCEKSIHDTPSLISVAKDLKLNYSILSDVIEDILLIKKEYLESEKRNALQNNWKKID